MRIRLAVIFVVTMQASAMAACFENLGQTGCTDREVFSRSELRGLSCQNLWYLRNVIYDEHGYCFKTKRAQAEFDNSDCFVSDTRQLRFNRFEQGNIDNVAGVERQKGCPR